jgi:hypothetical protein
MSNGARHGLGVLVGLVLTPLLGFLLLFGTERLSRFLRFGLPEGSDKWLALGALGVAAVLIGLLAGSRLSPLAALIPGAAFGALGVLWIVAPRWMAENTARELSPEYLNRGYEILAGTGGFLVVGFVLIGSALPLSRWRATARRTAGTGSAPADGPYGPPPGPPRYERPGGQQEQPLPQPPPFAPPGQSASPFGNPGPPPLPDVPQHDAQPQQRRDEPEEEPGEWTRMYGGGRDFRNGPR